MVNLKGKASVEARTTIPPVLCTVVRFEDYPRYVLLEIVKLGSGMGGLEQIWVRKRRGRKRTGFA
jgi:hypothetical protein